MFGRKKNVVATYSKNRPVQITRNNHFLTPDTPEDVWAPSSKEKRSKQDANKKGPKSCITLSGRRGSSLALRNISNIPFEKTLSGTPCSQGQRTHQTNRRLTSKASFPTKLSTSEGKECRPYKREIQRARHTKNGSSTKSKVLISTTTHSSKSMSCCSVCGNAACSTDHDVLSTIKSMSLCKSSLDDNIPDDFRDDIMLSNELLPHNSTLIEEDLNIELRDIIPQDLSAIIEEPVAEEEQIEPCKKSKSKMDTDSCELYDKEDVAGAASPPRCSTPVDPGQIHPFDSETQPNVSPIQASDKTVVPVEVKLLTNTNKSECQVLDSNEEGVPNITPETVSKKECTATDEPKQKRKLAYSMDVDNIPDCILLHVKTNTKHPFKLLCRQDKNAWSCGSPWSSLPVDTLVQLP